ncbi:alpha-amylase family protein [Longitalea arenae]|uniref:alpha-amylase family protein n=1 Tax=Longitalea arenae TaxID=2812558 RepID=UPI0019688A57|nr:alpha-amylase family protein [Longitalea arenae]
MKKGILIVIILVVTGLIFWLIRKPGHDKNKLQQTGSTRQADAVGLLWYKNSVIYTLDVEVFKDSDNNGVGDFDGLTSRLGYIDSLGADAVWLAPFQPTPNRDDGYDVSDYYTVDERLGTLTDFREFMAAAKERNMRVIMDLVINHTSDQHPWFKAASKDLRSPYHDWYIWSATKPDNIHTGMVFPGVQKSTWTYAPAVKQYYYHRFYEFQPDLNTQHPGVEQEIKKIIKHWMDMGIAGFRLDGVPFYIEIPKTKGDKFEHRFEMLTNLRHYVQSLRKDAVILGEANVLPEEQEDYFGKKGDGMHMMFNFFVNQHLFLSLANENPTPMIRAMKETADIPAVAQWGQFLRNHDEVDLGRLSEKERQTVYDSMGPQQSMQLYDRGVRRRLAPMLNDNRKKLELAYAVLFSLPSTPVLRYGDEIAMGDDQELKERESVRTPMQWSAERNSGFSMAARPVRPVIDSGEYSFHKRNVALQNGDSSSLLNWTRYMVQLRRQHPEIGAGSWKILETDNPYIFGIVYSWQGKSLLSVINFSRAAQAFRAGDSVLKDAVAKPVINRGALIETGKTEWKLHIDGYGYGWFELVK